MLIACIVLGVTLALSLLWIFLLKCDIRQLGKNLGGISHTDTNVRLTTDTFDTNIAALAKNINTMLERSRHDLFEKIRAEADLKRAITNISHDLRTPLTSARGYLQMLESGALDAETQARYLEIVGGRLEALAALMNSLFEFTRIIEGNTVFDIQKINVCDVLRDVLSASYSELEAKCFSVEADIPDIPVFCLCDEDALRRVLQNLLKNVHIHGKEVLRVQFDGTAIEIANRADGLRELDTERIFERFYIADASRTSKNTGLGLAIAKELVVRMGGQIAANVEEDMLVIRVALQAFH